MRQQLGLKNNIFRTGAQIISSEIIQTDDRHFSKMEDIVLEVNPGHSHENISNFKKYILRLSRAYQRPRALGRNLSLRNIKGNLSPRAL